MFDVAAALNNPVETILKPVIEPPVLIIVLPPIVPLPISVPDSVGAVIVLLVKVSLPASVASVPVVGNVHLLLLSL